MTFRSKGSHFSLAIAGPKLMGLLTKEVVRRESSYQLADSTTIERSSVVPKALAFATQLASVVVATASVQLVRQRTTAQAVVVAIG